MSSTGIYGLSGSGIDVDSMVKVGMMSKQSEYDRMYKKEVRQEWTKEAYANLYSDLTTFTTSTMSKYKMSATLNPQTVSSSSSTVATATANADAAAMTHYVNVKSMSSNAYLLTGDEKISRNDGKEGSLYLKDLFDTSGVERDGISFTVSDGQNESTITITQEQLERQTLNDLASAFNGAGLGIKASYDATNDSFSIYNNTGGSANGIYMKANDDYAANLLKSLNLHTVSVSTDANNETTSSLSTSALTFGEYVGSPTTKEEALTVGGTISYDVASKTYTGVTVGDSTATVILGEDGKATMKIGDKNYNGTFTQDHTTLSFKFDYSSTVTGDKVDDVVYSFDIVADASGNHASNGKKTTTTNTMNGMAGTDASVTIDGKTYTTDTNKLTVANVTYSFAGVGSSTMTVSQDTEKLVENVKSFVDDYNKLLDKLNEMYNEQKYSDYDVLTESQKKGMTEEQIEKWEEKAKSGLMHRNEYVGRLISDLREAIYTPVESVDGKYKTMMSLGIESKTDRGHLKIDEDKLRKVIAEDPDIVYQMMGNLDKDDDYSKNGVVQRVSDVANKAMKSIKSYAGTSTEVADGSSLGKLIQDMQQKMSNFKVMMNAFEDALYKKYDKMESAIQKLGVQLGYITGGQ